MDIRLLRYAVTLSEELHFARAAQRHYISAQPFGRYIQRLEHELGVRLFERTSHRVHLTDVGKVFVAQARNILASVDALAELGQTMNPRHELTLGVLGFGLAEHGNTFLELLRDQVPETALAYLDLDFVDQYRAVQANRADIAIVQCSGPVEGLTFDEVLELPRVAVVPAQSDLACADRLTHDDLLGSETIPFAEMHPNVYEWAGLDAGSTTTGVRAPASIPTAVVTTGHIAIHADAAARYYPHPGARFVPLDGPPVRMALATRTGDERPAVLAARHAAGCLAAALEPVS